MGVGEGFGSRPQEWEDLGDPGVKVIPEIFLGVCVWGEGGDAVPEVLILTWFCFLPSCISNFWSLLSPPCCAPQPLSAPLLPVGFPICGCPPPVYPPPNILFLLLCSCFGFVISVPLWSSWAPFPFPLCPDYGPHPLACLFSSSLRPILLDSLPPVALEATSPSTFSSRRS